MYMLAFVPSAAFVHTNVRSQTQNACARECVYMTTTRACQPACLPGCMHARTHARALVLCIHACAACMNGYMHACMHACISMRSLARTAHALMHE